MLAIVECNFFYPDDCSKIVTLEVSANFKKRRFLKAFFSEVSEFRRPICSRDYEKPSRCHKVGELEHGFNYAGVRLFTAHSLAP